MKVSEIKYFINRLTEFVNDVVIEIETYSIDFIILYYIL